MSFAQHKVPADHEAEHTHTDVMWSWRVPPRRLSWRRTGRLCSRLSRKKLLFWLLGGLCALFYFRVTILHLVHTCSKDPSLGYIEELCEMNRQGLVAGNMCSPLCDRGLIRYTGCTRDHSYKNVILVTCRDACQPGRTVPAVLKVRTSNVTSAVLHIPDKFATTQEATTLMTDIGSLAQYYLWEIAATSNVTQTEALRILWDQDVGQLSDLTPLRANAIWRSAGLLFQQEEYVLGQAFRHLRVFPAMYGTCGPYYVQESCPPGVIDPVELFKQKFLWVSPIRWSTRASAALAVLQLVKRLDGGMPDLFHMCDVKGEQFGLCEDGTARILDLDDTFLGRFPEVTERSGGVCYTHGDCPRIHRCHARCDFHTHRCYYNESQLLEVGTSPIVK
ncbi:hypothetical protein BaRGS_00023586 [Batillaria attramentaria]|uniref:FAM69 protein-kinase domain-containing protein n=1 Tax=Batillaria attramentaria TaxID=370345 RepID=A0ABD0KDJ8_9CAEN